MAEEQDQASKTEDPTPKRLQDAREKGQVPNSREITSWMILLSFAIFLLAFATTLSNGLKDILLPFMESPHAVRISKHSLAKIGQDSATDVLLLLAVPLGLAVLAAFLGPR